MCPVRGHKGKGRLLAWRISLGSEWFKPHIGLPRARAQHREDKLPYVVYVSNETPWENPGEITNEAEINDLSDKKIESISNNNASWLKNRWTQGYVNQELEYIKNLFRSK